VSVRSAGGIFGGKIDQYSHEYCASRLSMITGRLCRTKEAGAGRISGILAALGNAAYDATGVRLHSTPFSAEKILAGLRVLEYAAKKSRQGEETRA
jgi:CO/xanthine dehydrogenase Mo-binding subunit